MPDAPSLKTATPARSAPLHLGYLDSLRALAAVCVVLCHTFLMIWPVYTHPEFRHTPTDVTRWFIYLGRFSVDLFIVLSGYCLMLPVVRAEGHLRGGFWAFYIKRARRILPPYYAALLLSLLLIATCLGRPTGTHWDVSLGVTGGTILSHLLLFQDLHHPDAIDYPLWSVAVEWRIYLLFPLIVWAARRWGMLPTTLVALGIGYSGYALVRHTDLVASAPQYLGLFCLGNLAAQWGTSAPDQAASRLRRFPWLWISLACGCACLGLGFLWDWPAFYAHIGEIDLLAGAQAASLLLGLSVSSEHPLRRLLSLRPLVFLGTFAYSIYLIHAPILQLVWQYLVHPLFPERVAAFRGLLVVGTPLALLAAYVFFLVCERHFLSAKARPTRAETVRDTALSPAP